MSDLIYALFFRVSFLPPFFIHIYNRYLLSECLILIIFPSLNNLSYHFFLFVRQGLSGLWFAYLTSSLFEIQNFVQVYLKFLFFILFYVI